jgi:RNA polymerase sigma-70 factor (ECF subfamily)
MNELGTSRPDPEGLGGLLDAHGPPLILFARQYCEEPEDAVQDVFVKLAARRRWPHRVVSWLYAAVRNRAISIARATSRRRRRERRAVADRDPWFEPSAGTGIDAGAATDALRELPEELRAVVVARLWGGLTFEETGRAVGCSSSAAHRRYEAAIAALRERLGNP